MKIINNILNLFLVVAVLSLSSCETFDLDQTENPSTLPPEMLDPVYAFNYAQLTLPDFVNSANSFTQRVTRQMAMTGGATYDNAFAPVNFDNNWTTGYLMLNAIKLMEPKAQENGQTFILGASKVIRCYVLMTMVDMYGDIPYSEALQGNNNRTPKYDASEDVYAGVYAELDQAIELLGRSDVSGNTAALKARDLYYGDLEGNPNGNKWVTLAKTLKLKMLHNSRVVGGFGGLNVSAEMTNILAAGDYIKSQADDFVFRYGSERDLPNSRHPLYNDQYEFGGGAYIANYFFWAVSKEKGITDPREAFYFYKQAFLSGGNTNSAVVPCKAQNRPPHYNNDEYASFFNSNLKAPYCFSESAITGLGNSSYLGRDHGDASGIPQDDAIRSVVGLYPAGGAYGAPGRVNDGISAGLKGALGEGIMPILMSSYVKFIKAEAMQAHIISGDAREELIDAINTSLDRSTQTVGGYPVLTATAITALAANKTAYIDFIRLFYDELVTDEERIQLIVKEYYIAAWGNGIEPYNNYRRTGYPSNLQPTLEESTVNFFSTALYPGASVNNNPNAPSNVRTKRVFWDAGLDLH